MGRARPNVLLISPGYTFAGDGNFGDTHLVALGSYLQAHGLARVEIVDLDYESRLPHPDPQRIFSAAYDVVGISCYSSYEYLKSFYLGVEIRRRNPAVCLVVGGYHPSARPNDFTVPDSPFDYVVMGEGELPLAQIVSAVAAGRRLPQQVLSQAVIDDLDTLPPHDWTLLDRYKPIARRIGGQVTLYLSRGCPFRCVFCMEAAKGDRRWRAFSPERAEQELLNLHRYLDLTDWKVFFTDPLFAIRRDWRQETLDRLQRLSLPVAKYWALTRADILGEGDLQAFHRANFGLGFGLESGDPAMLKLIHKGGRPQAYLDTFVELSGLASEIGFPWGANMIAGHPGETPETLTRSAEWIAKLIRDTPRPTGFLSIDPYRFYPGAPIDLNLRHYEATYGTRVHRPRWWNYSEPEFTAEWVDPSRELDYRTKTQMTAELFQPTAAELAKRYAYRGSAADYFYRSVTYQLELFQRKHQIGMLRRYFLWRGLVGEPAGDIRYDAEVNRLLRDERQATLEQVEGQFGALAPALRRALVEVPRERFLASEALWQSTADRTVPLTEDGESTISALHAYAINYRLLALSPGDHLLELGGGSGYGAAVAAQLVGERGAVTSVEIRSDLSRRAAETLSGVAIVRCVSELEAIPAGTTKILFCFAIDALPQAHIDALPLGGRLVAPIRASDGTQRLTLVQRGPEGITTTEHGTVRYVGDRKRRQHDAGCETVVAQ